MNCPKCNSSNIVKNGSIHNGKRKSKCKGCGRQFVANPAKKRVDKKTKYLIDKLLLERIPITGMGRVTGISEAWPQSYINKKYKEVEKQVNVKIKKKSVVLK